MKKNDPIYEYAQIVDVGHEGPRTMYQFQDENGARWWLDQDECKYSDGVPWDILGHHLGFIVHRQRLSMERWRPFPPPPPEAKEPQPPEPSHEERVEESLSEIAALLTDIYRLLDQRL